MPDAASSGGLYKTTFTVWTRYHPGTMSIIDLAREATAGDAYSPFQHSVLVPNPEADPDWGGTGFSGPGPRVAVRLLCDHCYTVATGDEPVCQPGCRHAHLDSDGACLWPEGPVSCQHCGHADRLTPVPASHEGLRNLPKVAERGKGQWWLSWPGDSQGPFPSRTAAWDAWHTADPWQLHARAEQRNTTAAGGARSSRQREL